MDIKEVLSHLNDAMTTELNGIKALKGDADKRFRELFDVKSKAKIYYTKMNMVITDEQLMMDMKHFLKAEDKVLSIEIPEYNVNVWIYEHFNNQVVSTYFPL
ncbi:MAG: hypothetical protein HRU18_01725 [Pseudoalteromonas sp.]|uniref:hypothetical protein n=1 Tax=Pseudoalteromonas sp. TaxID=53249 RepID=UPI001E1AC9DB|nr:hypothetical protein [Pseudoalteromonas sp.]NRA76901.1 hypothetical protein [Pseudoalteromonas sp.]